MYYNLKEAVRVRMADSDYVRLVNDVCSDESWGPTGQQMDEVVKVFHCGYSDIMEEVIRRLEKRHKSWRRCYKALLLVDYLARNLQERYVDELRRLLPLLSHISTTFHYKDEKNVDHGLSIRERSKKVAELLKDPEHLANERRITQETQRRVTGAGVGHERIPTVSAHTNIVPTTLPGGGHHYGHNVRSEASSRSSPSYDPYPGAIRGAKVSEDADMAFARRLQEEEDRRAGRHLQEDTRFTHNVQPSAPPSTSAPKNQEDEDLRLAMELQRQFDDADGTDNTAVTITQAHATPPKPQPAPPQQPVAHQPAPIQPPKSSAQSSALDDIFSQPSPPQRQVVPEPPTSNDFDFFASVPASRSEKPKIQNSDPFGDDFFNGTQASPAAPSQTTSTWGRSVEAHNPPPRPTTKDPFADLVRVAMSQGSAPPAETSQQAATPSSSVPPPYDAAKRQGDLDDLFS